MSFEFVRLTQIASDEVIELMNNPRVREQMPLFDGPFGTPEYNAFIDNKEALWEQHGFGPWAFRVDGQFAGWGGLQPENGEADLALVLHPRYWGLGMVLFRKMVTNAFGSMGLESITILLPPTRTRIRGLNRLGFTADGEVKIDGVRFNRYRLLRPKTQDNIKRP